jgi:SpoVK/Ycf46/Vps4 family AAA+-type ATPase
MNLKFTKDYKIFKNQTPEEINYLIKNVLSKNKNIKIKEKIYEDSKDKIKYLKAEYNNENKIFKTTIQKTINSKKKEVYRVEIDSINLKENYIHNLFKTIKIKTRDKKKKYYKTAYIIETDKKMEEISNQIYDKLLKEFDGEVELKEYDYELPFTKLKKQKDLNKKYKPYLINGQIILNYKNGEKEYITITSDDEYSNENDSIYGFELNYLNKTNTAQIITEIINNNTNKNNQKALVNPINNIYNPDIFKNPKNKKKETEFNYKTPNKNWTDLGGIETIKQEIYDKFIEPRNNQELYNELKIEIPNTLLLYGPPGTGKTSIAQAIAKDSNAKFLQIKTGDINSKWVGESEKNLIKLFNQIKKEKDNIILFLDEIDGFIGSRNNNNLPQHDNRFMSQFNQEMNELPKNVIVIGATNVADNFKMIDDAVKKRFKKQIEIPLPNEKQRESIFKIYLDEKHLNTKNTSYNLLAKETQNLSGREIESISNEAKINAIKRYAKENNKQIKDIKKDEFNNIKINLKDINLKKEKKQQQNYLG